MTSLTERSSWKALQAHFRSVQQLHLRQLFADDAKRGERFTVEAAGLFLDYSKNRITEETLRLLLKLADECGLRQRIDAMFSGGKINVTEGRGVFHAALRAPAGRRSSLTARTWFPRFTPCWTAWLLFPSRFGRGSGAGIRARGSAP